MSTNTKVPNANTFLRSFGTQRPPRPTGTSLASTSIPLFQNLLASSTRVLVICGAGLSAASGLSTFRGSGTLWRGHLASALATHEAFSLDPGLVWLFFSSRRHAALSALPNAGHFALASLCALKPGVICVTQNFDGLSQRGGHPVGQLKELHGSIGRVKCSSTECDYVEENLDDPITPELDASEENITSLLSASKKPYQNRISFLEPGHVPILPSSALPHCPACNELLRPDTVWFGEALPKDVIEEIDGWIEESERMDLCLVVGTTATVYPAAKYVKESRKKGARVAVVNTDDGELGSVGSLGRDDFWFKGGAEMVLPVILGEACNS